jgi:hypothetical protein
MGPGGTLRMVFEADAWDSNISFAPGIPVTLGGTLELTFANDVNLASQVGRTFDLFDWTGVTLTGAFAVSSPYHWLESVEPLLHWRNHLNRRAGAGYRSAVARISSSRRQQKTYPNHAVSLLHR